MAQDEHPREEEQEEFVPDDDRPQSFDRMTPAEQREGDSINTRVAREEPDDLERIDREDRRADRPADMVEPNEGEVDDIGELVATEVAADRADDEVAPEERAMSYREEGDEA